MKGSLSTGVRRALRGLSGPSRLVAMAGAIALLSTACDVHGVSSPGALSTLSVAPTTTTLVVGATQQFTASATDAAGVSVPVTPAWSVVAGGGSISATGLFTAGATTGTYASTVQATSGTNSAFATVIVTAAPAVLTSITVTPNPDTLLTNASQQFAATGKDQYGNAFPISPSWSVVNGGGSIDANTGAFTAGSVAGSFANTVEATVGTMSGTATVVVRTPPAPPGPPAPSLLGRAAPNGIMAGTAFSCVNGGTINADIAISPGSTVTGFPPCVVTGTQHLADAVADSAQIDLTAAYNMLAGMACPPSNKISADLGGTTLPAGVYCSAGSIGVTGTVTLNGNGDPNALFVFQAGTSLTTAGNVVLINGAQAKNVYWQVGSSATLGSASQWQGNIVALTSITLVDNATLTGRALARNGAVSLGSNNTVTLP